MTDTLQTLVEKARPVFEKYHFRKVGIFGSRARGDYRSDSDIDFLVASQSSTDMFSNEKARSELEAIFGVSVDVVPDTMVVARMRPQILKDLKIIYEG